MPCHFIVIICLYVAVQNKKVTIFLLVAVHNEAQRRSVRVLKSIPSGFLSPSDAPILSYDVMKFQTSANHSTNESTAWQMLTVTLYCVWLIG